MNQEKVCENNIQITIIAYIRIILIMLTKNVSNNLK